MGNTLDVFKAQQQVVERVHSRLTEVATLVASLKAQVDNLRLGQELRQTLDSEQAWLSRTTDLLRDVQQWRMVELRQARRAQRWRGVMPFAGAPAASAAAGAGLVWAGDPDGAEVARLPAPSAVCRRGERPGGART